MTDVLCRSVDSGPGRGRVEFCSEGEGGEEYEKDRAVSRCWCLSV